jgi:hypothetical protein
MRGGDRPPKARRLLPAPELPLADDLLLHALHYALADTRAWARLCLVCRQFRRCLDAPGALTDFPGFLQVYGSSLNTLAGSRSAAGLRCVDLQLEHGNEADAVQSLRHFRSLLRLKLTSNNSYGRNSHAMVTDSCLRALTTATPTLISLCIWNASSVTNAGLACIAQLTLLQALALTHLDSVRVTTEGLCELISGLVALQELSMRDCGGICDATLQALHATGALKSLRTLDLQDCERVGNGGLVVISHLTALRQLRLDSCGRITNAGLRELAQLAALQELEVRGLGQITDAGLEALLAPLTALRALHVHHCDKTTHGFHNILRERRLSVVCHDPVRRGRWGEPLETSCCSASPGV